MISQQALSILLVEDDEVASLMIGRVIAHKFPGVIINIANNGTQGLDLFIKDLPDLVITDINMSEMDGIQMTRSIKSLKDDTHFIVITGFSDQYYMEKFREIGVTDYIVKPIDFEKLFIAIEKCIV